MTTTSDVLGEQREVRLPMADGAVLAATLYLPGDATDRSRPCLLEALPYRKDDLTSGAAETYERLRDEFGLAVCRLDLRGTGSSSGDATDEYPLVERTDLVTVIEWLAAQPWCNGNVGMFGTSYSGFNSLQIACERPPALKAVCAIYATDDRWTDDVHWRGGALRFIDLVDYCHYMTPMTMLPPVPAVWGPGWRDEWLRRVDSQEPWLLTWLRQSRHGDYWRNGSVRLTPEGAGYDRIACPVLIVAGWADGYCNNSFRTVEALREAGVPHRLLAGPWAHADPATAIPGPRIDLTREMAAWFTQWLDGPDGGAHRDRVDLFVRSSTPPEVDLELHEGRWVSDTWPSPASSAESLDLGGAPSLTVVPDVGTSAWNDCAGHLPWGLTGDQRVDDSRSLLWEWPGAERMLVGHPRLHVRVSADAPAASLSVKLCDVFPDGTSALVTRGTLDLAYRNGVHGAAEPLVPGEVYDVVVDLDACAYELAPGQRLRLAVAGADWPNTVAPPAPVRLTVHEGRLELPLWSGSDHPAPTFTAGADVSSEDPAGVVWAVTDDVLRRTTTCTTAYGGEYDVPYGGTASERYEGEVVVDRRTFAQHAAASCSFRLTWPEATVSVVSTMRVDVTADGYDVRIDAVVREGDEVLRSRTWEEHLDR